MSAWTELAGDDSNLSMAADEFVDIKVLTDISNSMSRNRSPFDPELDSSKQGLNRQLKLFGLGSNSNSGLSKKRPRSELQGDGDQDMPPKSKQRTAGPQDFSRFLDPSPTTSCLDLSVSSSSCLTGSTTSGSIASVMTSAILPPHASDGLYAAIIGLKGRSAKKSPTASPSSPAGVPRLVSQSSSESTTANATANPTPNSNNTVKLMSSLPSSVRRRRLMRRRTGRQTRLQQKPVQCPRRNADASTNNQEDDEDVEMDSVEVSKRDAMDEDDVGPKEGQTVLETWGNGKIYVPSDIVASADRNTFGPRPSPFRLVRNVSKEWNTANPQKLSFSNTAESSPPAFNPTMAMTNGPFCMDNYAPLPIASSFGLSSTSVSVGSTPNNEGANDEQNVSIAQNQPISTAQHANAMFPFVPLAQPSLLTPQPSAIQPLPCVSFGNPSQLSPTVVSALPMNFGLGSLPLQFTNFPVCRNVGESPPVFVPVQSMASNSVIPIPEQQHQPHPIVSTVEPSVASWQEEKIVCKPEPEPRKSVWRSAEEDEETEHTWARKFFRDQVARNKTMKRDEEANKVEIRKREMVSKRREKELLPIEKQAPVKVSTCGSYGTHKQGKTWRREYHPYNASDDAEGVSHDAIARRRQRNRSMSQDSPCGGKKRAVWRKADSTSESGTTVTSASNGRSVSPSTEARESPFPYQEPQPVTEETIAKRTKQIELAKTTTGYTNYIAQLPKNQRKKHHPQTPNPKENIAKRRWVGKYNKWRKLLHEFDDIDESAVERTNEENLSDVVSTQREGYPDANPVPPSPSLGDENECLFVLESTNAEICEENVGETENMEQMDVDSVGEPTEGGCGSASMSQ